MKLLFSTVMIGFALAANAQQDGKTRFMPMATRTIGISFQKFDGLNSRIANLPQFKELRDYTGVLGLGWLKERNRVVATGNLMAGSSLSGDRDKRSSTIRYLGIDANIGYDVLAKGLAMLYPLAGIGVQGYQAIFYKDNSAVAFNDVLTSPVIQNNIRSVRFTNVFVVYKLGVGFSLRSPKNPANSIGLLAGYTGSFKKNDWKSNEYQTLSGAPEDKVSQVFIGVVLTSRPWHMK